MKIRLQYKLTAETSASKILSDALAGASSLYFGFAKIIRFDQSVINIPEDYLI